MSLADIRHCIRVANISMVLADALDLSRVERENLYVSGLFHDIGKAFLSQDILNKPGQLTASERKHIEEHPVLSYQEVKSVGFSEEIATNILNHHENYDGSGYPYNIEGYGIPLGARIIRITDTFDALTSHRPYRSAITTLEALEIMERQKVYYDPELYSLFSRLCERNSFSKNNFKNNLIFNEKVQGGVA